MKGPSNAAEMNSREQNVAEARKLLDDARLIAFLRHVGEEVHFTAVRLINEHLDEERTLDDIFYNGEKSVYTLAVDRKSGLEFVIAFGCLAGPTAGDGAKWEVEYDEAGNVVRAEPGEMWIA
ncbi:MAG: YD repeat-containing protein [Planctomycetota bacterium]|jgi:YD repeat-containing protein